MEPNHIFFNPFKEKFSWHDLTFAILNHKKGKLSKFLHSRIKKNPHLLSKQILHISRACIIFVYYLYS